MNGETATKQASWWVLIVVALLIGGFVGYYLGAKKVGSGLIGDGQQAAEETSVIEEIAEGVEAPANPFEEGAGYQNPFEEVKVNPFAK